MTAPLHLTEYQRRLLSSRDAYFFHACVKHFAFLVTENGYDMGFEDRGRGCHEVDFTRDIGTEYFAVRIFYDYTDMVWCEVHRFAGTDHQRRLRLGEACRLLGVSSPSEHLDTSLPPEQTVPDRVSDIATCIRSHLGDFRNLPVNPKNE